jgi:hypothetical protein
MPSWALPTPKELDRVAVLCARPENRAYFFDRLDNPNWVGPLSERGFFMNPPSPVPAGEPGFVRFPPWPEGRYLARVAARAPEQVASVLASCGVSENPAVTGLLLKALASLPSQQACRLARKAQEWAAAPFADYFADDAADVALRLLEDDAIAPALDVVGSLLEVQPDPRLAQKAVARDSPLRPNLEPAVRMSEWQYERALQNVLERAVDTAGIDGVRLFAGLLETALRLSRWEDESDMDDLSYVWRAAIENHEQNSDRGIRNSLISAVHDAAIRFGARGADELETTINTLEPMSTVHRRIALHVLASTDEGGRLAAERLTSRELFDDHQIRHEYVKLLRTRFRELDAPARNEVISWIEAGPDVDRYRRRRIETDGEAPNEDDVARYVDLWRRDRYSFVEPHLEGADAERYRTLVQRFGEPEHPDFISWSSSWSGAESPTTKEDLVRRSPEDVLNHLRRWRPEDDSGWHFGPSIEGLGRVFGEVVAERANDYAPAALDLIELDPTYVRGFFSGLIAALRDGTSFPWDDPLALSSFVVSLPFEPDVETPDRDRDPGWRWCRREIASLLRAGLTDKESRIPFDRRERVWKIIERLTTDPNPSPQHEARYGGDNMDPFTLSINTNRGTALHAVVEYALWCRRELESRGHDATPGT